MSEEIDKPVFANFGTLEDIKQRLREKNEYDTDKQPVVFHMNVDYNPMNPHPPLGATNIMGGAYANPWVNPSYSQPVTYNLAPAPDPWTDERLREIVAKAIKEVLYPDTNGLATHQHRRVRQWDENGDEWRGVLYKMERPEHAELHKRIEDALHKVEEQ